LRFDVEALLSPRRELVGVHPQAHRAARAAPLGSRLLEHHIQALGLGLQPDPDGPWYDEHPHGLRDVSTPHDLGRSPQVLDTAVGA
jgi:hypothetical protein